MTKSTELMPLWQRRWQIAPCAPPLWFERYPALHPRVLQILYNRGVTSPEAIQAFLAEEGTLESPWRMAGMHEAVFLIRQAVMLRERGARTQKRLEVDHDGVETLTAPENPDASNAAAE